MLGIGFLELWFCITFSVLVTKLLGPGDEEEIKKEPVSLNTDSSDL